VLGGQRPPRPEAAVGFYRELFGWEATDTMPPEEPGRYHVCTLRGRDVAAVGSQRGGGTPGVAAWGTYVWVDDADATAERAAQLGGKVLMPAFDTPVGRTAVLADPRAPPSP
jgi:predicted enzyme related to lactoylglutathione lyase